LERNPLRILDCKNEGCRSIAAQAPSVLESLCTPCQTHLSETRRQLELLSIPYKMDSKLVRGLDYYTRTAFELLTADPVLGTASAVGGGGRYDKLIESLGGPSVPGVGWAMGMERLALLLKKRAPAASRGPVLFITWTSDATRDLAL